MHKEYSYTGTLGHLVNWQYLSHAVSSLTLLKSGGEKKYTGREGPGTQLQEGMVAKATTVTSFKERDVLNRIWAEESRIPF